MKKQILPFVTWLKSNYLLLKDPLLMTIYIKNHLNQKAAQDYQSGSYKVNTDNTYIYEQTNFCKISVSRVTKRIYFFFLKSHIWSLKTGKRCNFRTNIVGKFGMTFVKTNLYKEHTQLTSILITYHIQMELEGQGRQF